MDLKQKHKILSDILRLTKKEYRKNKEKTESTSDLRMETGNVLKKLNKS
ncbi:MAG: hypothetical protein WC604_01415 [Candidatus Gracilibacteria bacterium]